MMQTVKLKEILSKNVDQVEIEKSKTYTQVTVRLWGKGVCKRDEVRGSSIKSGKRFVVKENQFIISKIDARHGACGLIPKELDGAVITSDFPSYILDTTKILPQYFQWIFSQKKFIEQCKDASSGTTNRIRLNESRFLNLDVSLPSIAEQQKVTEQLNKDAAIIRTIKEYDLRNQVIVQNLKQAILQEAVSGKLVPQDPKDEPVLELLKRINAEKERLIRERKVKKEKESTPISKEEEPYQLPESWEWVNLNMIKENSPNALKAGPFGSNLRKNVYVESGYKIYGQEQVIRQDPKYGTYYIDEYKYKQLESCAVKAGDILISLVGTVGKVLILPEDAEAGIINPRLVKLSLYKEISREYVRIFLNSPVAEKTIRTYFHGSTMDIINLGILKRIFFPLPPINEQRRIVRKVDQLMKLCDDLEENVKENQENASFLMEAVLEEAFAS